MKKDSNEMFDLTIKSNNGAEVCKLVGMFALTQLPATYYRRNIRLYQDNSLTVFRRTSSSEEEHIKRRGVKTLEDA